MTLGPSRNRIRELEVSLFKAVERTRISITENENSVRSLEQRVVDLEVQRGVLERQAEDARSKTIVFSVVSVARYYMRRKLQSWC
jgi:hypothetical protein